ncbi:MAG: hypothetical protein AB1730_14140 [Myxococcota bacterium]
MSGRGQDAKRLDVHPDLRRAGQRAGALQALAVVLAAVLAVASTWLWPTAAGNVWLEILRSR